MVEVRETGYGGARARARVCVCVCACEVDPSHLLLLLPLPLPLPLLLSSPSSSGIMILAGQEVTCADVLYSGHTVNLTLCALIWHYYSHVDGALLVDTEVTACPSRPPVGRLIGYCILHTLNAVPCSSPCARMCCLLARGRSKVDRWSASKRIARSPLLSPLSPLHHRLFPSRLASSLPCLSPASLTGSLTGSLTSRPTSCDPPYGALSSGASPGAL